MKKGDLFGCCHCCMYDEIKDWCYDMADFECLAHPDKDCSVICRKGEEICPDGEPGCHEGGAYGTHCREKCTDDTPNRCMDVDDDLAGQCVATVCGAGLVIPEGATAVAGDPTCSLTVETCVAIGTPNTGALIPGKILELLSTQPSCCMLRIRVLYLCAVDHCYFYSILG